MAKSPAFQLYVNDFLGSAKVGVMNGGEVGVYFMLLLLDWQEVGFEFNPAALSCWCRVSESAFTDAWRLVGRCFVERKGRMFNPRLELERRKQATWRKKSRKGGVASGKARTKGGSALKGGSLLVEPPTAPRLNTPFPLPLPLPVTTSSLLSEFPDKAHRDAVETALRGQHPQAVEASIRALQDGTTRTYPFAVIGRALVELQAAGTTFSAKALDAFCRRILAGDPPPRGKISAQAENEATLARWGERTGTDGD